MSRELNQVVRAADLAGSYLRQAGKLKAKLWLQFFCRVQTNLCSVGDGKTLIAATKGVMVKRIKTKASCYPLSTEYEEERAKSRCRYRARRWEGGRLLGWTAGAGSGKT